MRIVCPQVTHRQPYVFSNRYPDQMLATVAVVFIGAVLGALVGALAGELIEASALFDITVTPRLLFTALGVSVATGVFAAYLPARRAARLDPAAAIRGDE